MHTANRKMLERDARVFIREQHNKYFEILHSFFRRMNVKPPTEPDYTIVDCIFRHCGQYDPNKHTLQYSIPYCVHAGDEYHITVAHEMSHAFQRYMRTGDCNTPHGETFLWMLAECGIDVSDRKKTIFHPYNVVAVDRLAEELKRERGGSDHITMQPVRRKSLKELIAERNHK